MVILSLFLNLVNLYINIICICMKKIYIQIDFIIYKTLKTKK